MRPIFHGSTEGKRLGWRMAGATVLVMFVLGLLAAFTYDNVLSGVTG